MRVGFDFDRNKPGPKPRDRLRTLLALAGRMDLEVKTVAQTVRGGYHAVIFAPWNDIRTAFAFRALLGDDPWRLAYDRAGWKRPIDILFHVRRGVPRRILDVKSADDLSESTTQEGPSRETRTSVITLPIPIVLMPPQRRRHKPVPTGAEPNHDPVRQREDKEA